jgi:hypothetical protein
MNIRKIILASHISHMDRKTHVKNFIKDTEACVTKDDYVKLLEDWNHHEPERVVEYILNEYSQYSEEKVNIHIAWSLKSLKEVTGIEFTIDYIDTHQYPDYVLDAHERELFADFN